ncbi:MAG: O-antigen ligase family protein [Chloroflexi bacterium]|nr:O-antigen ligase family protein [Chloroflexota bacterium]MBP8058430.1 O-antigen ligase family protein [Chloroflexota bacterium]
MTNLTNKTLPHSSHNTLNSPLLLGFVIGLVAIVGGAIVGFGGPLAGVAFILGVVAVIAVLRDIEIGFWGVIGVVCLLPFATLPVDIGLTPTFLDLALGAVVGIWVLGLVTGQQRTVVTAPITLPLVIFIIVAVFAFIFGLTNGPLTTNLLRHFAELILSLGFVLIVVDYCRSWERLERLVKVMMLAAAAAAALGIFFWLLPDDTTNTLLNLLTRLGYPGGFIIRYIEENPELSERAIGTSVDPNSFGGLLLMMGALVGPQLLAVRPQFPRWQVWGLFGLIFLALVLTFSRGAMAGLIVGLFFIIVVRYRRWLPALLLLGALGIGLIFILPEETPLVGDYVSRAVAGLEGEDLATQMRIGEYRDAVELIGRYPMFGVGFAGSPDLDLYLGVAMVYLTIGQQMGVLGLLAFFAVIGTLFGYAFFNRHGFKTDTRRDPIWLGLHAAVIGGLTAGLFDHYLFNIDFHHAVTVFWMLVGLAVAATRLAKVNHEQ